MVIASQNPSRSAIEEPKQGITDLLRVEVEIALSGYAPDQTKLRFGRQGHFLWLCTDHIENPNSLFPGGPNALIAQLERMPHQLDDSVHVDLAFTLRKSPA